MVQTTTKRGQTTTKRGQTTTKRGQTTTKRGQTTTKRVKPPLKGGKKGHFDPFLGQIWPGYWSKKTFIEEKGSKLTILLLFKGGLGTVYSLWSRNTLPTVENGSKKGSKKGSFWPFLTLFWVRFDQVTGAKSPLLMKRALNWLFYSCLKGSLERFAHCDREIHSLL